MRRCVPAFALILLVCLLAGCVPAPTGPAPTAVRATPRPSTVPATATAPAVLTAVPGAMGLIVLPDDGIGPVLQALAGARRSIHLVAYLITEPRVLGVLKDAAGRGVDTRVLLEEHPQGGAGINQAAAAQLTAAGVKVQWSNPVFHFTHEKVIVVDGSTLIVLTANLTKSSFSENREFAIVDREPADVAEVMGVFEADWSRQGIDLRQSRLIWAPDNARTRTLELLDAARSTIDLEEQSVQDNEVIAHLTQAMKRGVKVRHLSSPREPLSEDTNEPGRQALRKAGAEVRYFDRLFVHAKMFVIDGQSAFVGSENLTSNSLDFNREAGVVVRDRVALARLQQVFEADWAAGSATAGGQPAGGAEDAGADVVAAGDAARYEGRKVTVELKVADVMTNNDVTWLMPDTDRERNFKAVIFARSYAQWSQAPALLYRGHRIRVTGKVQIYRGFPEIIVNEPAQIEVVERGGMMADPGAVDILAAYEVALEAAGYDVVVADVVTGRRERGAEVVEVVIDAGGRLRLTSTRALGPARSRRVAAGTWQFRVLRERTEQVTVMVELGGPAEVAGALVEAERLASGPLRRPRGTQQSR